MQYQEACGETVEQYKAEGFPDKYEVAHFPDFENSNLNLFTARNDFTNNVSNDNVVLHPGMNTIELRTKATRTGLWKFRQVRLILPAFQT